MGMDETELDVNFYAMFYGEQKPARFDDGEARLEEGKIILDGTICVSDLSDDFSIEEALFHGEAVDNSDHIGLKLDISAPVKATCARCTRTFEKNISTSADLKLTDAVGSTEDSDYSENSFAVLRDGLCDVSELVRTMLIVSLPMRFLCSEDCKGLCPKCGANLNEKSCGCSLREVDPRLSKLTEYLKKLENNTDEEVE